MMPRPPFVLVINQLHALQVISLHGRGAGHIRLIMAGHGIGVRRSAEREREREREI